LIKIASNQACAIILIIFSLLLISGTSGCANNEFSLTPQEKTGKAIEEIGNTEVGTGWSVSENPREAVNEAINMALNGKTKKIPDFVIVFATSGSDMQSILSNITARLGNVKIYGGTSASRAVMTDKGLLNTENKEYSPQNMEGKKGLAIMTIYSKEIIFGVGSANLKSYDSAQKASKAAILEAIKSAGKSQNELPKIILVTPTRLIEEEILEGIEEVVGKNTIIIGGTAGGPPRGVFGKNEVYEEGVSLAVIYTNLSIGWVFEGGFDVNDLHSGIVTKSVGQEIIEIDNRPAVDVYNDWLGGEIVSLSEKFKEERPIRDLLTLHPLYRKFQSESGQTYFLFSHPWPTDFTLKEKSVMTSTKIKVDDKVYLSHGTWETLLNRIGNLPKTAKANSGFDINEKPILGIGYICNGVFGAIPETERGKIPILTNYANNNAPFITPFTSGEQGHFPGVGNKHGNLLTSFIVIRGS